MLNHNSKGSKTQFDIINKTKAIIIIYNFIQIRFMIGILIRFDSPHRFLADEVQFVVYTVQADPFSIRPLEGATMLISSRLWVTFGPVLH